MLLIAVLTATGTHWLILQSIAWTTMLADNLRETTVVQAVEHTFDGKHPCRLCKAIARGKQEEKETQFPIQVKRFEFLSGGERFVFVPPTDFWLVPSFNSFATSISFSPPRPPPRVA